MNTHSSSRFIVPNILTYISAEIGGLDTVDLGEKDNVGVKQREL